MNLLTSQIIVNILNNEMTMPPNSVWIRDQNVVIPNDNGLYIVVGLVSSHTMSNNTYMELSSNLTQTQLNQVQQSEDIQIDILSRSNDALSRNWEVIAALQSFYAQQQMELNNFKIMRCPRSFTNTSSAEGGSTLNRYSLIINCMVWYRKEKLLVSPLGDYYNDFKQRGDDDNSIGTNKPVFTFEINSSGVINNDSN